MATVVKKSETFDPKFDRVRLGSKLARVRAILLDGKPHTIAEIQAFVGKYDEGVSANVRDLRKAKYGGWDIPSTRKAGVLSFQLMLTAEERAAIKKRGSSIVLPPSTITMSDHAMTRALLKKLARYAGSSDLSAAVERLSVALDYAPVTTPPRLVKPVRAAAAR